MKYIELNKYSNQFGDRFGNQFGNHFGNRFGNSFGNRFDELPQEIKKEIFLQNALHYQSIIANLMIDYHKLYNEYNEKQVELEQIRQPNGLLQYYLSVYENTQGLYSKKEVNMAYNKLEKQFKPMINKIKEELKEIKNKLLNLKNEIHKNKKMYYLFYNNFKKI